MRRLPLFAAVLLALPLMAQQTDRQFPYTLLAPGIAASAPVTVPLRTVPARLVLRYFAVGQGTAKDVPNSSFAVMELHAGHVFTTVAGDRQERVPGDFWTVPKGATITFELLGVSNTIPSSSDPSSATFTSSPAPIDSIAASVLRRMISHLLAGHTGYWRPGTRLRDSWVRCVCGGCPRTQFAVVS